MKKIVLYRPKENFNKNCAYKIFVGKKLIGELKNGEEKIINIPNESKEPFLKAKIQWCGSNELELNEISENEKIIIKGNDFLNRKLSFFGAVFPLIGIIFFNLKIVSKEIGIAILTLLLIGIISTLTILKNKWLHVKSAI